MAATCPGAPPRFCAAASLSPVVHVQCGIHTHAQTHTHTFHTTRSPLGSRSHFCIVLLPRITLITFCALNAFACLQHRRFDVPKAVEPLHSRGCRLSCSGSPCSSLRFGETLGGFFLRGAFSRAFAEFCIAQRAFRRPVFYLHCPI